MKRLSARSILLGLAAPVGALVFAALVCAAILAFTGHSAYDALYAMVAGHGPHDTIDPTVAAHKQLRTLVNALNSATQYYLSAVAVAIGFRMKLFNIGVDGQYRMATMLAAALAGASFMHDLPQFLRVLMTLAAAMLVGGIWAGIAGFLKVTRGVSEVISTIMLNAIATSLVAFMNNPNRLSIRLGAQDIGTRPITEAGQVPGFTIPGSTSKLYGLVILAVVVGAVYWFVLSRTRFGFDLKATGLSESAAVASGVSVKRMVLYSMLISGAVAGLVGMPDLLGNSFTYSNSFQAGLGFVGIAVALLGRNHPIGMAVAAVLWGLLDSTANSLNFANVPKEIVAIMQGVIVLSVVVAYELVRRYRIRLEQRDVGKALGTTKTPAEVAA